MSENKTNAKKDKSLSAIKNLAYSRSISPTYFAMYGAHHSELERITPVEVRVITTRSEKGNAGLKEEEYGQPNLQAVGLATLSPGQDTLVLKGAIKLIPNYMDPNSCSNSVFEENSRALAKSLVDNGGLRKVAQRFAINLASGQWAARNCAEASARNIIVKYEKDSTTQRLEFDGLALHRDARVRFDLNSYPAHKDSLETLTDLFVLGLTSETGHALMIQVEGYFLMGPQACVFPSEGRATASMEAEAKREYNNKQGRNLLFMLTEDGKRQAVMRDAKVGNPLRMVDTWHGDESIAIATEPYGSNSHRNKVYRGDSKKNFYALIARVQKGEALTEGESLYFLSMLLRGGVFGGSDDSEKAKTESAETLDA